MPCKPSRVPPVLDQNLRPSYSRAQPLFSVSPGITLQYASTEARKLMDCARYLDQTAVMSDDKQMKAAAHHVLAMVKVLLEEIEQGMLPSRLRAQFYAPDKRDRS